ncbi:hypothetical protein [Streptomyces sp. Ac-502]|uniref:hypothetical protein n=1 Tax=Streptomyces sp. Ac-502 TaxID=3342801 RepID=UPI0038627909
MTVVLAVTHILALTAAGVILFRALHAQPAQWLGTFDFNNEVPPRRRSHSRNHSTEPPGISSDALGPADGMGNRAQGVKCRPRRSWLRALRPLR